LITSTGGTSLNPDSGHILHREEKPVALSTRGMTSSTSSSRFKNVKIVPVESKYKRGRWDAYDYYSHVETEKAGRPPLQNKTAAYNFSTTASAEAKSQFFHFLGPPKIVAQPPTPPVPQHTSTAQSLDNSLKLCLTDAESDDRENMKPMRPYQISLPSSALADAAFHLGGSPEFAAAALGGRITPIEMLHQYGLERSLSVTSSGMDFLSPTLATSGAIPSVPTPSSLRDSHIHGIHGVDEHNKNSSPSGASAHATQSSHLLAIDSKIEQAMDLVKTHLMFAVREEVEHLRAKIVELETTVIQLEAENSILREHVPEEILQTLGASPVQSAVQSGAGSSISSVKSVVAQ